MKLQKFTTRDIVFTAIIAAAFLLSGFISIPLVMSMHIYGLTFLISSVFYAFFIVILLLKVKKPGCVFLAGLLNGLALCMMSSVMLFMQATAALLCEVLALVLFRSYDNKKAIMTAAISYMPIMFPVGIVGNILIKGGTIADAVYGDMVINIVSAVGVVVFSVLSALLGWKIGSELKRAGKLK